MRTDNPYCRIRNADQLGPRTHLDKFVQPVLRRQPLAVKIRGSAAVAVVGRQWKLMWEDGQAGIYKLQTSSGVAVKRTHELMNSDQPQLVEGLMDKTLASARKVLLDGSRTSGIVNPPRKLSRVQAFKGLLDNVDEAESEMDAQSIAGYQAGAASMARVMAVPRPRGPDVGGVPGIPDDEEAASGPTSASCSSTRDFSSAGLLASLRPAAKPSAQPKAKAPKQKAKAKAKALKDEHNTEDDAVEKRSSGMVESMQPPETKGRTPAAPKKDGTADALAESDEKWMRETTASLADLLNVQPESEDVARSKYTEIMKDIATFKKSLTSRRRTVNRRLTDKSQALTDVDEVESKVNLLLDFVKLVSKPKGGDCPNAGDESYAKIIKLMDYGAHMSTTVFIQVVKLMWLDDFSWKRWDSMNEVTFKFLERVPPATFGCGDFMLQNMNVYFQKLLKEVRIEPPFHEKMDILIEFVSAMDKVRLRHLLGVQQFEHVRNVLTAAEVNPMNVVRSVDFYDKHCDSSEHIIFASFKAFPAGKKLIELAREFATDKLDAFNSIMKIDEIKVECAAYIEQLKSEHSSDVTALDIDRLFNDAVQFNYFQSKLLKASTIHQESLEKDMNKVAGLGPLPVYSEEKEAEFLQLMLETSARFGAAKTLTKDLTAVASSIEECLKLADESCVSLGFDEEQASKFLPKANEGHDLCKTLLEKVSVATCLKILHSRAASNKASTISDSVDSVLEFISINSVCIPPGVKSRMTELQGQIAAPPAKRAKTAQAAK
eukprot:Skav204409  [mRNA]  locus=scaffold6945:14782:21481:- [translate_table: standard]